MQKNILFITMMMFSFSLLGQQNYLRLEGGVKLSLSIQHEVNLDPIKWTLTPDYATGLYWQHQFKNDYYFEFGTSHSGLSLKYKLNPNFLDGEFQYRSITSKLISIETRFGLPIRTNKDIDIYATIGVGYNRIYSQDFREVSRDIEKVGINIPDDPQFPSTPYRLIFTEGHRTIERENISFKSGFSLQKQLNKRLHFNLESGFQLGMSNLMTRILAGEYRHQDTGRFIGPQGIIYNFTKGDHIYTKVSILFNLKK
jgi:opacity protein-like surface antigen